MQALPKPELAYLAAIFHDIAKGRGGDHSELGAVDAEAFCLEQGLSRYDARLVAWLVKSHLMLSVTAQKKDISDPKVIYDFARFVGDQTHLDYLYVLTVVRRPRHESEAVEQLEGIAVRRVLRAHQAGAAPRPREPDRQGRTDRGEPGAGAGSCSPRRRRSRSASRQSGSASRKPISCGSRPTRSRGTPNCSRPAPDNDKTPLVAVRRQTGRGGTAVLTYTLHTQHSFARTTAFLDQMGLTIVDARIMPTEGDFSLDCYHVLEDTGSELTDSTAHLRPRAAAPRGPRQAAAGRRHGHAPRAAPGPHVLDADADQFQRGQRQPPHDPRADRRRPPGLLSEIGKVFMAERVDIHASKIMTIGERAEDVFYITDYDGKPLDAHARERLQQKLVEALDRRE